MSKNCRRPVQLIGKAPRRSELVLKHLAPESWKSVRGHNLLQTGAKDWGGSQEIKSMIYMIDTGILEVCEWSDCVAYLCLAVGRVTG